MSIDTLFHKSIVLAKLLNSLRVIINVQTFSLTSFLFMLKQINLSLLTELLDKIKENGPNFILTDFDKLYSLVK